MTLYQFNVLSDQDKAPILWEKGKYIINLFEEKDFTNTKLAGITAIEKLVGKSEFSALLDPLVVKAQGAPTLVPESDKRPAFGIEQAKSDFSD